MTVGIGFLDSDSYGTASAISRSRKRTSLLRPCRCNIWREPKPVRTGASVEGVNRLTIRDEVAGFRWVRQYLVQMAPGETTQLKLRGYFDIGTDVQSDDIITKIRKGSLIFADGSYTVTAVANRGGHLEVDLDQSQMVLE